MFGGLVALCLAMGALPATAVPEGPAYPSPEWAAREEANFARAHEEGVREATDPAFLTRLQDQSAANIQAKVARDTADPTWIQGGGTFPENVCGSWAYDCAGDPFLYPPGAPYNGTDAFYTDEAVVVPVVFYDDGGARLNGRVWAPKSSAPGDRLPGVVIETGSVQAPEPLYWWFAETLVRSGYVVLTFDVRGQGYSDNHTPSGDLGTNFNSSVFWDGLVDAIDFFRSTPGQQYPWHSTYQGVTYPTVTDAFNPLGDRLDPDRLGIVGHSLGATGVSIVQGYGAPGAPAWPGKIDAQNPVKVAVAWDNLSANGSGFGGSGSPPAIPRVPAMGSSNDYDLTPHPYTSPPDPEAKKTAFHAWEEALIPSYQLVIQGGTHFEYSLIPNYPAPFPSTNWKTWGNPFANHYSLAWLDRWLKLPGETGYADADARLLADQDHAGFMSFYMRSARDYPDRAGFQHLCQDIRAGCTDTAQPFTEAPAYYTPAGSGGLPNTAAGAPLLAAGAALLLALTGAAGVRARRRA
ncbi:MAG: hypothetical protein QOE92_2010 [Chloroflexota bacterium]|jgi:hypothetical protein|nr:hypothetical protein [Chloroflexota bacterium]